MASVYYGINRGKNFETAVVASSTSSTDVEIRVDSTKILSREELFEAIEQLENYILQLPYTAL